MYWMREKRKGRWTDNDFASKIRHLNQYLNLNITAETSD